MLVKLRSAIGYAGLRWETFAPVGSRVRGPHCPKRTQNMRKGEAAQCRDAS